MITAINYTLLLSIIIVIVIIIIITLIIITFGAGGPSVGINSSQKEVAHFNIHS